jgi:quercetin dioxygenase-like cupin family protein
MESRPPARDPLRKPFIDGFERKRQMNSSTDAIAPIVAGTDEGEALWAFGGLARIKASAEATGGDVAVTEQLAPKGAGSPLHVHHREHEWFYVIEGELTLWVGGETIVAPAGTFVFGPKGIPHTFMVSSEQARFLLVAEPGGFDRFMRAAGEPAQRPEIPPPAVEPPDVAALTALAAEYGIEIIGPPGIPV